MEVLENSKIDKHFEGLVLWLDFIWVDPNIFWGYCLWPPSGFFLGSFLPWLFSDSFYITIHIVSFHCISQALKMILPIRAEVRSNFLFDYMCGHHYFYYWNNFDKLVSTITKNSALTKILKKIRPNIYKSPRYSVKDFILSTRKVF